MDRHDRSAFAEQYAALGFVVARAFDDLHQYRVRGHVKVLHHRIRDVLDQRALLLLGAALDGMDIDAGIASLLCLTIQSIGDVDAGRRGRCRIIRVGLQGPFLQEAPRRGRKGKPSRRRRQPAMQMGLCRLGTKVRTTLLEEDGFELPVRGRGQSGCRPGAGLHRQL